MTGKRDPREDLVDAIDYTYAYGVLGYDKPEDLVNDFRNAVLLEMAGALRRTPPDSPDYAGALRGARLIEEEVRRSTEHAPTSRSSAVAVPQDALRGLVRVAMWVSRGRSFAFTPDPDPLIGSAYPDAAARRALGALDDAGLLEQFRRVNVLAPHRPENR